MSLFDTFFKSTENYAKTNPVSAAVILGGVSAVSAVALLSANIDLNSAWPSVLILLGIGILVMLIGVMLTFPLVRVMLGTFLLVGAICWCFAFGATRIYPENQTLNCLVYFWEPCRKVADDVAEETRTLPPPADNGVVNKGAYRVFVQFAGAIAREEVRAFMRNVDTSGWNVQGVEGGGERTAAAAGLSEIRYTADADKKAAEELAAEATAAGIIGRTFNVRQITGGSTQTLELWMGR